MKIEATFEDGSVRYFEEVKEPVAATTPEPEPVVADETTPAPEVVDAEFVEPEEA